MVTLVHGTFARNAAWTQANSSFRTLLADRMRSDALAITRFGWSGWNSPWSRRNAAIGLRAQLEDQLARYPDARHYVIGHSHGGAVALQAAYGDGTLRERLAGVATLATPYIQVRERGSLAVNYSDMLTWVCFLPLAAVAAWKIFEFWLLSPLTELFGDAADLVFWLGLLVSTLGAAFATVTVAAWLSKALLRLAKDASDSLRCPVPQGANLLIVRSSADEASALLASSQLFSWFVSRIWDVAYALLRPLFMLLRALKRFGQVVPAALIMSCFVLLLVVTFGMVMADLGGIIASAVSHSPSGGRSSQSMVVRVAAEFIKPFTAHPDDRTFVAMGFAVLAASIIVLGGMFALLALFVLPALVLLSVVLLPFGAESALAALLVELSVETVPEGSWTVHQFGPSKGHGEGMALMHSAAYADDRVLGLLASWMRGETKSVIPLT